MNETNISSVVPAKSVDLHPVAGNVRINITYRCYRDSLKPEFTPQCECKEPSILRTAFGEAGRGKRYFWSCNQGYKVGATGCAYFAWAEFDEFGEPPWSTGFQGGSGGKEGDEGWEKWPVEMGSEGGEWSDETVEGSERDGEEWEDVAEEFGEEGELVERVGVERGGEDKGKERE